MQVVRIKKPPKGNVARQKLKRLLRSTPVQPKLTTEEEAQVWTDARKLVHNGSKPETVAAIFELTPEELSLILSDPNPKMISKRFRDHWARARAASRR